MEIHEYATSKSDANFCEFLETELLQQQVDQIKQFADHVVNITRAGNGVGVYIYDRDLLEKDLTSDDDEDRPPKGKKKKSYKK